MQTTPTDSPATHWQQPFWFAQDHPQYADISKGIKDAADLYQQPNNPEAVAKTVANISVVPAGKSVDMAEFMRRAQDSDEGGGEGRAACPSDAGTARVAGWRAAPAGTVM